MDYDEDELFDLDNHHASKNKIIFIYLSLFAGAIAFAYYMGSKYIGKGDEMNNDEMTENVY